MARHKMNKWIPITIILFMIAIVAGLYYYQTQQAQVTSSTFVNPDWARLECAPTDAYEGITTIYPVADNRVITCGADEYTDECRLTIKNMGGSWTTGGTVSFYLNNQRYQIQTDDLDTVIYMDAGEQFLYEYSFGGSSDKVKIIKEWRPWKLYRFVGGAKWTVNSANCDITSSTKANIRSEDYTGARLYREGGEGTKWMNYINAWNYGPATNVFKHDSYGEVYCNAGQIFDIVELHMADGKLVKVDPQYSDTLPSGDVVSGQGSKLGNVECCPNEPNCGDDFEFEETTPTCFTDSQCLNAGGPIPVSNNQYLVYKCLSGLCTQTGPFSVECTTNAACPTGQVCDLSTTNYGKCITQIGKDYCGDGICGLGETADNCPKDCKADLSCEWWQDSYTSETKDYGALYWRFFIPGVDPVTNPISGCKTSGWVYMLIVGGFVLAIIIMIIYLPKKSNRRR